MFTLLFAIVFTVFLAGVWIGGMGALLYFGTRDVLLQQKLLQEAKPIDATIVDRTSVGRTVKNRTNYYPVLRFEYVVDGKTYTGDRLTPLNYYSLRYSTPGGAANHLVETYPSDAIQVFYLPSDPTLAYVRREAHGGCYAMVAGGLALATPLLWGILNFKQKKDARDAKGRLVLRPGRSLGKRKFDNAVVFLFSAITNGVLIWHYYTYVPGPHGWLEALAWSSTIVMPLLALFGFVRAMFIAGAVSDATITIDDFKPGRTSAVVVEQDVLTFDTSVVEKVRIALKCVKQTGSGKHARYETVYNEGTDYPVNFDRNAMGAMGGKRLRIDGAITLPSGAPVTVKEQYITFAWTLSVRTSLLGKPDYVAEHLVEVTGWQ